jgi:hypothetical protein
MLEEIVSGRYPTVRTPENDNVLLFRHDLHLNSATEQCIKSAWLENTYRDYVAWKM